MTEDQLREATGLLSRMNRARKVAPNAVLPLWESLQKLGVITDFTPDFPGPHNSSGGSAIALRKVA